jgi:triacylglycerol lipase
MNLVFATGFLVPQIFGGLEYYRELTAIYPNALFPAVPVVGNIATRAKALAEQVQAKFPAGRVHIVAHSMGGLDGRMLISEDIGGLASAGRIGSLSTISTPHLGSAVADFVCVPPDVLNLPAHVLYETVRTVIEALGMPVGAMANLTTTFCKDFDAKHPDRPDVRYFSYAGAGLCNFFLKATHSYLQHVGRTPDEVLNDGLVTLASARHNGFTEAPWTDADHVSEVGWQIDRLGFEAEFDYRAAIARIVARLET